jgi:hypothetical protein
MIKPAAVVLSVFCICQCSPWLPGRAEGIDPNPYNVLERQAKAENRDPGRISIPVLRSASLEKRWGAPKLLVGPKGGYLLRYQNPTDEGTYLTILGSPTMFKTAGPIPPPYTVIDFDKKANTVTPREVSQTWRKTTVAGREVRYYTAEGNFIEPAADISTETFRLTAPDGRTASYRIRTASNDDNPANSAESLMRSVAF